MYVGVQGERMGGDQLRHLQAHAYSAAARAGSRHGMRCIVSLVYMYVCTVCMYVHTYIYVQYVCIYLQYVQYVCMYVCILIYDILFTDDFNFLLQMYLCA